MICENMSPISHPPDLNSLAIHKISRLETLDELEPIALILPVDL